MKNLLLVCVAGLLVPLALCAQTRTVTLQWDDNQPGVTYNIYRAAGTCAAALDPNFTKLNTSPISGLTFVDSNVTFGAKCYYATAEGGGIESDPSNKAEAVVKPLPPANLTLTLTMASLQNKTDCDALLASYLEAGQEADPFENAPRQLNDACLVVAGVPTRVPLAE